MKKLLKPLAELSFEIGRGIGELGERLKRDFTELPRTLLFGGHTELNVEDMLRRDDVKKQAAILNTLRASMNPHSAKASRGEPAPEPQRQERPLGPPIAQGKKSKKRRALSAEDLNRIEYKGGKLG